MNADPSPSEGVELVRDRRGRVSRAIFPASVLLAVFTSAGTGVVAGARWVYADITRQIEASNVRFDVGKAELTARIDLAQREREDLKIRIITLEANASNATRALEEVRQKTEQIIAILLARADVHH